MTQETERASEGVGPPEALETRLGRASLWQLRGHQSRVSRRALFDSPPFALNAKNEAYRDA